MKKFLILMVATMFAGAAKAQIVSSTSKQIKTTYTTETKTIVNAYENYNRIYFGYAPTKFKAKHDNQSISDTMHGFDLGWTGGYNVTKGKHLPLYVEAGLAMNADFDDPDGLVNFEIPVNVTYRYNIGQSKVKVAPYFGIHFKINAYWGDGDDSYFDYEGTKRFQMGMQLGVNFDINHFYVGVGWDKDFNPIWKYETYYDGDAKMVTSGARVNLGFTF